MIDQSFTICPQTMQEKLILLDAAIQLPRLLDEISAVCERDMSQLALENGLPEQDISDTINTASWLFELEKDRDSDYAEDLKPQRTLTAPIGYIADLYLRDTSNDVTWATLMRDSMSIGKTLLNLFRGMAKADAKQYLFCHYLKSSGK